MPRRTGIVFRILDRVRAVADAVADGASGAAPLLHVRRGRVPYLQLATITAAIPLAAANDRAQSSVKLEDFPQYIRGLRQGEMKLAGGNELAVAHIPSATTLWRLRTAMLPETADAHVPTPTRIRAMKEPANAQSIAAAVATLTNIDSHNMFNMDTTTVPIGDLMSHHPKILLVKGSTRELGHMNVSPGAPRGANTSLEYFPIPLNVTHAADGSQYHVGVVIKHAVLKDISVFSVSDRVSIFAMPINFDRATYFFHYFNQVVLSLVRIARKDLQHVRQLESQAVSLTPFSAASIAADVGAAAEGGDDDVSLISSVASSDLPSSSSSSAASAAGDDEMAMPLSEIGSSSDSGRSSSISSPSSASASSIIRSAFFCDGDVPQMNMLLSQAVQSICDQENLTVVKFPAASSARSQPHDRKGIAVELHRHCREMIKDSDGVPSVAMRRFIATDLTKLGLPPSSLASLRRFLSHSEAIFAIALSPRRCQESWGDHGTGYRNQNGEMNLKAVLSQYVHWKEMDTADAQRMIEYVCALMLDCACASFSDPPRSAPHIVGWFLLLLLLSHSCSAHPLLVEMMEVNGYVTDEQYWQVMTSLGFDKQKYSLRDDSDEVDDATHVTRRRAVVVSSPGFLAELREQRAEAARKVAAIAAAKEASAAKRQADQLIKAANAEARVAKKLQQVWVTTDCIICMGWRIDTDFTHCFPSLGASDFRRRRRRRKRRLRSPKSNQQPARSAK